MLTFHSRMAAFLSLTAVALSATAGPVTAHFSERAIESELSAVTLPIVEGGKVSVHPCARCSVETYTTDTHTRYLHDGRAVTLADLRALTGGSPAPFVTVLLDAKTGIVTRILIAGATTPGGTAR